MEYLVTVVAKYFTRHTVVFANSKREAALSVDQTGALFVSVELSSYED